MVQQEDYEVTLYEDEWQFGKDGSIQYSPFQNLQNLDPKYGPISYGCLTFAGHDLEKSNLLLGAKLFSIEFYGETPDELYHEAWADPLRANILKSLSAENQSWYISFVGDITQRILLNGDWKVPEKIFRYFSEMDPKRVATVMSEYPFGMGRGFFKRIFFEIPNEEIEWAAQNIWQEAMEWAPIEGYNLPAGRMDLIRSWDQRQRDDHLFLEVLQNSFLTFFTFPEEPRHFKFVTLNLEVKEFARMINLELLQQKAIEIGRNK